MRRLPHLVAATLAALLLTGPAAAAAAGVSLQISGPSAAYELHRQGERDFANATPHDPTPSGSR